MKKTITCQWCNNTFSAYISQKRRFCSRKCKNLWCSKQMVGDKHPNWGGGELKLICNNCNKVFYRKRGDKRPYKHTFCSIKCKGEWMSKYIQGINHPAYKKVSCRCLFCGNEFFIQPSHILNGRGKFCSKKCLGKHFSDKLKMEWKEGKRKTREKRGIYKRCEVCSKSFYVIPSCINIAKYCSKKCQGFYAYKHNIHKKPSNPEKQFIEIIKKYKLPYKYVGDGKFWIENINPDFVEVNGKKICVEIFGKYWHSPLMNKNIKQKYTYEGRKKQLEKYGWKCVVFWDDELNNEERVLELLKKGGE